MEQKLGIWPGEADAYSTVGEAAYWEQLARMTDYYLRVSLEMLKRNPDILITYASVVDDVGHDFSLDDVRQSEYEAELGWRRVRYEQYLRRAYRMADRFVQRLLDAAPGANFLVISDHGMTSEHSAVGMPLLVSQLGIRVSNDASSEVLIVPNGPSAHIYINTRGKRRGGVVPPEKEDDYVTKIAAACRALRDPSSGEAVFEAVAVRDEIKRYHMWHAGNAGELWVNARPGYVLSLQPKPSVVTKIPFTLGAHGHLAADEAMKSILFAFGPLVPRRIISAIENVQVAPTIATLAGIEKPRDSVAEPAFVPRSITGQ
jgi:predicted AlkP superfamily pyrophosphatase or phosphodiesterase